MQQMMLKLNIHKCKQSNYGPRYIVLLQYCSITCTINRVITKELAWWKN